jgi:DNA-binding response OmpR family regulator
MTEAGMKLPARGLCVPKKVLLIDDDPALVRMIRLALLSEGWDVDTASDGQQGLERSDGAEYDIVVLDLQMPNLDGRGFYREYRARGGAAPVVLLSAYGAQAARAELGADAAVTKPFDPVVLIRTVRTLLQEEATCNAGRTEPQR